MLGRSTHLMIKIDFPENLYFSTHSRDHFGSTGPTFFDRFQNGLDILKEHSSSQRSVLRYCNIWMFDPKSPIASLENND